MKLFRNEEEKMPENQNLDDNKVAEYLYNKLSMEKYLKVMAIVHDIDSVGLSYTSGHYTIMRVEFKKKGFKPISKTFRFGSEIDNKLFEHVKSEFLRLQNLKNDIERIIPDKGNKK